MFDIIIRDATIISSQGRLVSDIAVEDGKIADVGGPIRGRTREELQGIGLFVMPGVIDTQVRMTRPGPGTGHDWVGQSRAALAAGTTSVVELPVSGQDYSSISALQELLAEAAAHSVVDHGLWMPAGDGNRELVSQALADGLALAPYVRMDIEDGPLDGGPEALEHYLTAGAGVVGVHAEDPDALAKARRKLGTEAPPHELRSTAAAAAATEELISIVRETGGSAHLCSLSTATELNLLDPIRGDVAVSGSVAPQHLFLSIETCKEDVPVPADPPVRGELDRRGLWAAIRRGRVDCFHSAHLPLGEALARGPVEGRPVGLPSVDLLLPLLMSAVKHGRLNMERLVGMCCEAPAEIFGLANKGRIAPGCDADLVFLREGETHRLRKAPEAVGVGWTPFRNREVGVLPHLVIAGGRIASRHGLLVDDLRPGRRLTAKH